MTAAAEKLRTAMEGATACKLSNLVLLYKKQFEVVKEPWKRRSEKQHEQ